ncbi:MAG: M60 family metallopeptidase [Myxococcota bacterium]
MSCSNEIDAEIHDDDPSGSGGATNTEELDNAHQTAPGRDGQGITGGPAPAFACAPPLPPNIAADWEALTAGVTSIDLGGGAPSALLVHGPQAFRVINDADGDVVVAAARRGLGRVVVWGHENQLTSQIDAADAGALAVNAARWAGDDHCPVVGVAPQLAALADFLTAQGFTVITTGPEELDQVDVFAAYMSFDYDQEQRAAITAFVDAGGGLLLGGQAWWWGTSHPDVLTDYPGNRLLEGTGITVTEDPWAIDGPVVSTPADAPTLVPNATHGLDALRRHWLGEITASPAQLDLAFAMNQATAQLLPVPAFGAYYCQAGLYTDALGASVVPTEANPIAPDQQPFEALALTIDIKRSAEGEPAQVTAHPAASDFPGDVGASSQAISRVLTIDGDHAGRDPRYTYAAPQRAAWRSTGLYAPAGAPIEVTVPSALVDAGLVVQIGSHTDTLWHRDQWERVPAIVRRDPIVTEVTTSASAFGGLVYVLVPVGATLGAIEIEVSGAHLAPHYVHGQTTSAQWVDELRDLPAPWAELESDAFVITVPAAAIRDLDDPVQLMDLWGEILDAQATLAAIPHDRPRAERFVLDRQISNGWMHAGYPMMGHIASTPGLIDRAHIETHGSWGPFHELGHGHQWRELGLPGVVEATVNLWSVHTSETVLGLGRAQAHPALTPAARAQRIADYLAGGADFWNDWSVWTALETYLQLQEAFGWQPFIDLHADYLAIPLGPQWSDQQKIDEFALTFGAQVDRDLGPFLLAWGLPLSPTVVDQLAQRPAWAENPMQ